MYYVYYYHSNKNLVGSYPSFYCCNTALFGITSKHLIAIVDYPVTIEDYPELLI